MKWWKAHHGIATDRKYAVLLRRIREVTESNALRVTDNTTETRCHITRADIVAVWVWLIDFSSQNTPRGSIVGAPTDEIATSLDLDDPVVDRIIDAFRWRGMIVDNLLTAFDKRQPPDDPTNAQRQKRHREKLRDQQDSNALRNGVTKIPSRAKDGDGDGDGDGEVLVVNDLLPATEVLRTDGRNGTLKEAPHVNGNGSVRPSVDPNPRIEEMRDVLHRYMTEGGRKIKPPDDDITIQCLAAIGAASVVDAAVFLRDRFVNHEQSPRHSNGPRKYAWFPKVLSEQFGGRS